MRYIFDILTIGTATLDTFIDARFFKTITDPKHLTRIGFKTGTAQCVPFGSKIDIQKPLVTIGGGAINAAITFARSGFKVATLAQTGIDYAGALVGQALKKEGVFSFASPDNKNSTATSYILVSKGGERTILIHRGSSSNLVMPKNILEKIRPRWVYIVPGTMPMKMLKEIYTALRRNKTRIALAPSKEFIDRGIKTHGSILKQTNVITLNREEASYYTSLPYANKEEIFKKLDKAVDGIVVMTDGKNGATISNGRTLFEAAPFKEKKVVDQTGAGDAFGSGFVSGIMETEKEARDSSDKDIEYAIRRAMANATSVIEHKGATEGILTSEAFGKNVRWRKGIVSRRALI